MGGFGSGGHNRLSDEEKKRRGTFREKDSEAAFNQRAAAKVVSGPWLSEIPASELPLNKIGQRKYDELTRLLFDQGKLTTVTRMQAEIAARLWEKMADLQKKGRYPTASDTNQLQRAMQALRIAEDAQPIASPGGTQNRFALNGFSSRRRYQAR